MTAIHLENDSIVCAIDTKHGARITSLKHKGQEMLLTSSIKDNSKEPGFGLLAMIACVHHNNLAELKWSGTSHPHLDPLEHDSELHWGVGWQSSWQILEQEHDHALLSLEHRAQKDWPWLFDASQTIHLLGSELCLSLSMTNQSQVPSPCGMGWAMSLPMGPTGLLSLKAQKSYPWHHHPARPVLMEHAGDESALKSQDLDFKAQELQEGRRFGQWDGTLKVASPQYHIELNSKLKTALAKASQDTKHLMIKVTDLPIEVLQQTSLPPMLMPGESISVQMSLLFN